MVDRALVLKLAAAAHIELAPEEVDRLAVQLTDILAQIAPLANLADSADSVDVTDPADSAGARMADAAAAPSVLRADEPGADGMTGGIARFAPAVKLGFFTVPKLPSQGSTP